ncbi:hypothetical protein [uncultured Roseovarius sp.]|uniref:hypothetical protein n=1 Tax=uncultured Roseovarius sp. TaxID=293344 RepID=UPI00260E33F0|nr:hypothetical protein [uncultured Roseovarius sp.]
MPRGLRSRLINIERDVVWNDPGFDQIKHIASDLATCRINEAGPLENEPDVDLTSEILAVDVELAINVSDRNKML